MQAARLAANEPERVLSAISAKGILALSNLLNRKFAHYVGLTATDHQGLQAIMQNVVRLGPHEDVIQSGDDPRHVNVVLDGWACRYKQLEDGRRQIVALFLPGDMCDPYVFLLDEMSNSIGSLTPLTIARIAPHVIKSLMDDSPNLNRAFWMDMLASTEIQREWTVSLGRRTANERLAHLFCEVALRLRAVGLTNGHECEMPITQSELGDALGLSAVHVNRTLKELRATGLVEMRGRRLTIHDEGGLRALAMFDPAYLHLQRHPIG